MHSKQLDMTWRDYLVLMEDDGQPAATQPPATNSYPPDLNKDTPLAQPENWPSNAGLPAPRVPVWNTTTNKPPLGQRSYTDDYGTGFDSSGLSHDSGSFIDTTGQRSKIDFVAPRGYDYSPAGVTKMKQDHVGPFYPSNQDAETSKWYPDHYAKQNGMSELGHPIAPPGGWPSSRALGHISTPLPSWVNPVEYWKNAPEIDRVFNSHGGPQTQPSDRMTQALTNHYQAELERAQIAQEAGHNPATNPATNPVSSNPRSASTTPRPARSEAPNSAASDASTPETPNLVPGGAIPQAMRSMSPTPLPMSRLQAVHPASRGLFTAPEAPAPTTPATTKPISRMKPIARKYQQQPKV